MNSVLNEIERYNSIDESTIFNIGDLVETNEAFTQHREKFNKTFGYSFSRYERGTITKIKIINFTISSIPPMTLITFGSGFTHKEMYLQKVV